MIHFKFKVDFSSFYASFKALNSLQNPYASYPLTFLGVTAKNPSNLNTPFSIMLMSPLGRLSYDNALFFWQMASLLSLIAGLKLTLEHFKLCFTPYFFAFSLSYALLMNFFIGQIANFIFFFIVLGFYFLKNKRNFLAGLTWGMITGIKLFPGLLIFYALKNRHYKLSFIFCLTVFVTLFLPYCLYGYEIYDHYLEAIHHVQWYTHVWNASLLGYISRLIDLEYFPFLNGTVIKGIHFSVLLMGFYSYIHLLFMKNEYIKSQHFNITLIYMVILSPLGWVYYFTILIFPVSNLLKKYVNFSLFNKNLFVLMLLLLMFPRYGNELNAMTPLLNKMTFGSQFFYGSCLSLFLTLWHKEEGNVYVESRRLHVFKLCLVSLIYCITAYVFIVNTGHFILTSTPG